MLFVTLRETQSKTYSGYIEIKSKKSNIPLRKIIQPQRQEQRNKEYIKKKRKTINKQQE
jgi:hypothetical protein